MFEIPPAQAEALVAVFAADVEARQRLARVKLIAASVGAVCWSVLVILVMVAF